MAARRLDEKLGGYDLVRWLFRNAQEKSALFEERTWVVGDTRAKAARRSRICKVYGEFDPEMEANGADLHAYWASEVIVNSL